MSRRRSLLLLSPVVLATCLATNAIAAQRVYVASSGADAGGCTLAAPCRSFTYAMTQVDAGGEVIALDAAGYGAVTITKSVTIATNPGFFAGISAATGNAVTVNGEGINVTLRGLALNGLGATSGVMVTTANSVTIENCVVSNFNGNGIDVSVPAAVRILDTIVRGNGHAAEGSGIQLSSGARGTLNNVRMSNNFGAGLIVTSGGAATSAMVTDSDASGGNMGFMSLLAGDGAVAMSVRSSTASGNIQTGFLVAGGVNAYMAVSDSSAVGNGVGFAQDGGATFETYNNNVLRYNFSDVAGVLTPAGGN